MNTPAESETEQLFELAATYQRRGELGEAEALCARALRADPTHAPSLHLLGTIALCTGRQALAVTVLERATASSSRPEWLVALAEAYRLSGRAREAAALLTRLIELTPSSAVAHYTLGLIQRDQGELQRAASAFARATELSPAVAPFQRDLGVALLALGREEDAVASFEQALDLDLGVAGSHFELAAALAATGRFDDALPVFQRGVELDPTNVPAHSDLVFMLPFRQGVDDAVIVGEARKWNERHAAPLARLGPPEPRPNGSRRLRIGYVSADLRRHVQALYMLPLLEQHDRRSFEIICYSNTRSPDEVTELHRQLVHAFRDISQLSDEQAAHLVREDGIDILVDLSMHMENGRLLLFAHKPAPVQVSWLAYPGTTGLDAIDYRLTDSHIEPPEHAMPSAEEPWRLPDSFWCFRPWHPLDSAVPDPGPLPALSRGHITFGCLNSFAKTNDATFALWARVLVAVEGSRLVLLVPSGAPRRRVSSLFAEAGVEAARLTFVDFRSPRSEYLRGYQEIDIALDTLPYNGHTTSLDAWWMGVPVLGLVGRTLVGRATLCFARNLELPEWVAFDEESYVRLARERAADLVQLAALRGELRARMERSPLMDSARFARNIEAAYRAMWQRTEAAQLRP